MSGLPGAAQADVPAERALGPEEILRHRLVDDRDAADAPARPSPWPRPGQQRLRQRGEEAGPDGVDEIGFVRPRLPSPCSPRPAPCCSSCSSVGNIAADFTACWGTRWRRCFGPRRCRPALDRARRGTPCVLRASAHRRSERARPRRAIRQVGRLIDQRAIRSSYLQRLHMPSVPLPAALPKPCPTDRYCAEGAGTTRNTSC